MEREIGLYTVRIVLGTRRLEGEKVRRGRGRGEGSRLGPERKGEGSSPRYITKGKGREGSIPKFRGRREHKILWSRNRRMAESKVQSGFKP